MGLRKSALLAALTGLALILNPCASAQTTAASVNEAREAGANEAAANPCDLNLDSIVNQDDVLLAVNMTLGLTPCTANILAAAVCNVVVIQRIANAAAGGQCVAVSTGVPHTVSLTWIASSSPNVAGYNVYRGAKAGGPYLKMNPNPLPALSYTDTSVANGQTYYYVTTAVDTQNLESDYSNSAQAVIPQ